MLELICLPTILLVYIVNSVKSSCCSFLLNFSFMNKFFLYKKIMVIPNDEINILNTFSVVIIFMLLLLTNLLLILLSTQGVGVDKLLST